MNKASITVKDNVVIIHERGDKENVYFQSQLQEYEFNGVKRKCIDISLLDHLKENGYELTVY